VEKKTKKTKKPAAVSQVVPSSVEAAPAVPTQTPAAAPPPAAAPAVVATMADSAVADCTALLEQVLSKVGTQPPLSADEVRRATKMRKGGAEVIPKILALCQQQGITQIGSLTTKEMSEQLSRGDALVQVGLSSGLVQKKVRESAMSAHGRSWQIGTTMYKTLQRMAKDDPELALGIQPIEEFFQTKRTKGKVRANKKASEAKKLANEQPVTPPPVAVAPVAPAAPVAAPQAAPATTGH
jgi:hypothetical protein